MCDFITPTVLLAANLAVSAGATTLQIMQGDANADAQEVYQQKLADANVMAANEQSSQLRIQEAQTREAQARETERARLATQKAKATARVGAGTIEGNSVDAMLSEYDLQLGQFKEATLRQQQLNAGATNDQVAAVRAAAKATSLQINQPVERPGIAAGVIQFGGQALSAYQAYNPSAFKKKS